MKKYQVAVLLLALLLAVGQVCFAADNTATIVADGTYIMGDGETATAAELRAFENAKRSAIEQAGVFSSHISRAFRCHLVCVVTRLSNRRLQHKPEL